MPGVDGLGQRHPQEHPAVGHRPVRLLREVLLQRLDHHVPLTLVHGADRLDLLVQVPALDVLIRDVLREHVAAQIRALLRLRELRDDILAGDDPGEPEPRRQDLRKRANVYDPTLRIKRLDRRDRLPVEDQIPVGVVLDDDEVVLRRQLQQLLALLHRDRLPGRVLARRHRIQELGDDAGPVQPLQVPPQAVDVDARVINRDGLAVRPVRLKRLQRTQIRRRARDKRIPHVKEVERHEIQRLLRPTRNQQIVRRAVDLLLLAHPVRQGAP